MHLFHCTLFRLFNSLHTYNSTIKSIFRQYTYVLQQSLKLKTYCILLSGFDFFIYQLVSIYLLNLVRKAIDLF